MPPIGPDRSIALPARPGARLVWDDLFDAAAGWLAARAAAAQEGLTLIVANDAADARRWADQAAFFIGDAEAVRRFPDWETLPYDGFSPHPDIISERLTALSALAGATRQSGPFANGILVASASALMQRAPPRTFVDAHSFSFAEGDRFNLPAERARLEAAGYLAVETVRSRGEFAVRGSLVDIFPMGAPHPIRVDLLDEEIESLRLFAADTQMTVDRMPSVRLLPAREFPFDEAGIRAFRNRWHQAFDVDVRRCSVYQDVSAGIVPNGIEGYLPLFFDGLATLFDYLPEDALIIHRKDLPAAVERFWSEVESRRESLAHDVERPILEPAQLFLPPAELHGRLKGLRRLAFGGQAHSEAQRRSRPLPDLLANPRLKNPAHSLVEFAAANPRERILFAAESIGRRELLADFLARGGIRPELCAGWPDFLASSARFGLAVAPLDQGLWSDGLALVTESQIFGRRPAGASAGGARALDPEQIIRNFTELSIGAPVVHIEHGVGRYRGLAVLGEAEDACEYLCIEYAGDDRLYVPATSLHLIGRYSGAEEALAPLHRLGSEQWDKAKRRAAEKVADVAAELLDLYARRAARPSAPLVFDQRECQRFASQFPFELTADQAQAIEAALDDLRSDRPADRLICGDVGFGKTEVAMRAAFAAVLAGKQVAVLAPTTLLVQQHFDSFRDRFADWPVRIESVSRLRSGRALRTARERLAAGELDILIGTHKLLSADFRFADLGLVVIDEEHRFGVRQKERLQAIREQANVLALTATPIPRTLNMAMSGIRDLSIIATPPARRLSIKTFVREKHDRTIREAIERELLRGGQAFFVHNRVQSIERAAAELAALVPNARIGIGHGQMAKRELGAVMRDFYRRRLNVLVCTSIIENGLDIPNANTILIDRADRFGLAQLHQMRGRVGRSHRQAYAYLLTPHPSVMTANSVKRLTALQAAGELGVGFALATQDLEIRGAGELLGEEQSGQIESIGLALYMDLLKRAVHAMQAGDAPDLQRPLEPVGQEVNLHCATLIPGDYLPDVHSRLVLYKRIANADSQGQLDQLQAEATDRFGPLPKALKQLFRVTALKLKLKPLGIARLELGERGGKVEAGADADLDPQAAIVLVQRQPATYRLDGALGLRIQKDLPNLDDRFAFAEGLLKQLRPRSPVEVRPAAGA